jgi:cytochrome c biogenesis protein CcmG/thiol:disulfide interchange protein DsbE
MRDGGRRRVAPFIALGVAVVVGALFVVLAGSSAARDETAESFLLDKPAPRVVSTLLPDAPTSGDAEEVFDLSRRKGSWVVLNFFDPDCVPCIAEHPELIALDDQQRSLGDAGAELYTIINKGTDDEVRAWFDDKGGDWPKVRDPQGSISVAFGVAQVPETWIIDPNGIVRARLIGQVTAQGVGGVLQQLRETME